MKKNIISRMKSSKYQLAAGVPAVISVMVPSLFKTGVCVALAVLIGLFAPNAFAATNLNITPDTGVRGVHKEAEGQVNHYGFVIGGNDYPNGNYVYVDNTGITNDHLALMGASPQGGIYVLNGNTLRFANGNEIQDGGAIDIGTLNGLYTFSGGIPVWESPTTYNSGVFEFNNNYAGGRGGAIINRLASTVNISIVDFNSNQATGNGGAIYNETGTINLEIVNFDKNTTDDRGGAIYNNRNGTIQIDATYDFGFLTPSSFIGNQARAFKVFLDYNWVFPYSLVLPTLPDYYTVSDLSSLVESYGYTIAIDAPFNPAVNRFTQNTAVNDGGAIYNSMGTVIIDATATNYDHSLTGYYRSNRNGGPWEPWSGSSGVTSVTANIFKDNEALNGSGGAIYNDNGVLNFNAVATSGSSAHKLTIEINNNYDNGAFAYHLAPTDYLANMASLFESMISSFGTPNAPVDVLLSDAPVGDVRLSDLMRYPLTHSATATAGWFEGNLAVNGNGGAIYSNSTLTFDAVTNRATATAEAIAIASQNSGEATSWVTTNTEGYTNGGVFNYNKANDGGAIYFTGGKELRFTAEARGAIAEATAQANAIPGGNNLSRAAALADATATAIANAGRFIENTAGESGGTYTGQGGAIYIENGTLVFEATAEAARAIASINPSTNTNGSTAGANAAAFATVKAVGGEFEDNRAKSGGAIYNKEATLTFTAAITPNNDSSAYAKADTSNLKDRSNYIGSFILENPPPLFDTLHPYPNNFGPVGEPYNYDPFPYPPMEFYYGSRAVAESTAYGAVFTKNTAVENGGAIYNDGGILRFVTETPIKATAEATYGRPSPIEVIDMVVPNRNIFKAAHAQSSVNETGTTTGWISSWRYGFADSLADVAAALFEGNTAGMHGGAIYTTGTGGMEVVGITRFEKNEAGIFGGAIYNDNQTVTFTATTWPSAGVPAYTTGYSTFTENVAERGGAIYNDGILEIWNGENLVGGVQEPLRDPNLLGGRFGGDDGAGNRAASGGAIYNTPNGELTLTNVFFQGNWATVDGGAIYNDGGELTIYGGWFMLNEAEAGGAIYNTGATALLIIDSDGFGTTDREGLGFEGNKAEQKGGAIFTDGGTLELTNVRFYANMTTLAGGEGGAVWSSADRIDFTDVLFLGNTGKRYGGAIYNIDSTGSGGVMTFTGINKFDGNVVDLTIGNKGGAIYNDGGNLTFDGSNTFTYNRAGEGGAIYNKNGTVDITGGNFGDLNGTSAGRNEAIRGAAIYNEEGTLTLTDVNFRGNKASASGGAIYSTGIASTPGTVNINVANANSEIGIATNVNTSGAIDHADSIVFDGVNTLNVDVAALSNPAYDPNVYEPNTAYNPTTPTGPQDSHPFIFNPTYDPGAPVGTPDADFYLRNAGYDPGAAPGTPNSYEFEINTSFDPATLGTQNLYVFEFDPLYDPITAPYDVFIPNPLYDPAENIAGVLTMRGGMFGVAGSDVTITKTGKGIWLHEGLSRFDGNTTFTVEEGTFALAADSKLYLDGTVSDFTLQGTLGLGATTTTGSLLDVANFNAQKGSRIEADRTFTLTSARGGTGFAGTGTIATDEFFVDLTDGFTTIRAEGFDFRDDGILNFKAPTEGTPPPTGNETFVFLEFTGPSTATGIEVASKFRVKVDDEAPLLGGEYIVLMETDHFFTDTNLAKGGLEYWNTLISNWDTVPEFKRIFLDPALGLSLRDKGTQENAQIVLTGITNGHATLFWTGIDRAAATSDSNWNAGLVETSTILHDGIAGTENWEGNMSGTPVYYFMEGDTVYFADVTPSAHIVVDPTDKTVDLTGDWVRAPDPLRDGMHVRSMYVGEETNKGTNYTFNLGNPTDSFTITAKSLEITNGVTVHEAGNIDFSNSVNAMVNMNGGSLKALGSKDFSDTGNIVFSGSDNATIEMRNTVNSNGGGFLEATNSIHFGTATIIVEANEGSRATAGNMTFGDYDENGEPIGKGILDFHNAGVPADGDVFLTFELTDPGTIAMTSDIYVYDQALLEAVVDLGGTIVLVDAENAALTSSGELWVDNTQLSFVRDPSGVSPPVLGLALRDRPTLDGMQLILDMVASDTNSTELVWTGLYGNKLWDINTSSNWTGTVGGYHVDTFLDGDDVYFRNVYINNTGALVTLPDADKIVTVDPADGVSVASMTVTGDNFTFNLSTGKDITSAGDINFSGTAGTTVNMGKGTIASTTGDILFGSTNLTAIGVIEAGRDITFTDGVLEFGDIATITAGRNIDFADATIGSKNSPIVEGTNVTAADSVSGGWINFNGGNEFHFDVDGKPTDTILLTLTADGITGTVGNGDIYVWGTADLQDVDGQRITLIEALDADPAIIQKGTLYIDGVKAPEFKRELDKWFLVLTVDQTHLYLENLNGGANAAVIWAGYTGAGVANGTWKANDRDNWMLNDEHVVFFDGDSVTFADEYAVGQSAYKTVNVTADGVKVAAMPGETTAMYVTGSDYTFNLIQGGGISADGNIVFDGANGTIINLAGGSNITADGNIVFDGTDGTTINLIGGSSIAAKGDIDFNTATDTTINLTQGSIKTEDGGNIDFGTGAALDLIFAAASPVIVSDGTIDLIDATLLLDIQNLNEYSPAGIVAKGDIDLAQTTLTVSGVDATKDGEKYLIIETTGGVLHNFSAAGANVYNAGADYISAKLESDTKQVWVETLLTWNSQDNGSSHGTFTVDDVFRVKNLQNNTNTASHGTDQYGNDWDGKTLRKYGIGTLIMNGANNYDGDTYVNAGTLRIEDINGAGKGTVHIGSGATFDLAFSGGNGFPCDAKDLINDVVYNQPIRGAGTLVKSEDGIIVFEHSNYVSATDGFTGNTQIEKGGIIIEDLQALGTGNVMVESGATFTIGVGGEFAQTVTGGGDVYVNPARTGGTTTYLSSGNSSYTGNTILCSGETVLLNINATGSTGTGEVLMRDGTQLVFDFATNGTYAKAIGLDAAFGSTNDLGIVKKNANDLTLTGVNKYVGDTSIEEGRLIAADVKALGNGLSHVIVDEGANLRITGTGDFQNKVDGDGNLEVQIGTGSLILSGENDYTGTTSISGYVTLDNLKATGRNTSTDAGGPVTIVSGSLTIADPLGGDYYKTIAGGGSLVNNSGGTLTLHGVNDKYTGNTKLETGTTTAITNENALGSGRVTMLGDATLEFQDLKADWKLSNLFDLTGKTTMFTDSTAYDVTLSGQITGANGSLTKTGAGNLILSGNNSFNNGLTVSDGRLTAESQAALGNGKVTNNSELQVNFTNLTQAELLRTDIDSKNGEFIKGGDGRMNVGENFTAQKFVVDAGSIGVKIGATIFADTFEVLQAGTKVYAYYDGSLDLPHGKTNATDPFFVLVGDNVNAANFSPQPLESQDARVTSEAGFGNYKDGRDGLFYKLWLASFQETYDKYLSNNANNAAGAIDNLPDDHPLYQELDTLAKTGTTADVVQALSELHGEIYETAIFAQADMQRFFNDALIRRRIYCEHTREFKALRAQSSGNKPFRDVAQTNRELWVQFTGGGNFRSQIGRYSAYDMGRYGVFTGYEQRLNRHVFGGIAFGYDQGMLKLSRLPSSDRFDAFRLALYGEMQMDDVSVFGYFGYAKNWHNIERQIAFRNATVKSEFNDDILTAGVEVSKTLHWNTLRFVPSIGMNLVNVQTPFVEEIGDDLVGLLVNGNNYTSLRVPIGFRVNNDVVIQRVRFTPEFRMFYLGELAKSGASSYTAFAAEPTNTFAVSSGVHGRQGLLVGVGVQAEFLPRVSLGVDYNGELWSGHSLHSIGGNAIIRF